MMTSSYEKEEQAELLERAMALCRAFSSRKSIDEILENFSGDVVCFEHGLPKLAPFLGRSFCGLEGARNYFRLIGDLLDFEDMEFSDYMVDADTRQVSVRGKSTFVWKSTQKAWNEVFTYRLKFSQDDHKISSYEVWADSGAAYLASIYRKVMVVTYEFTYSPFSGNGILARSIVKSLLNLGCQVTVWCCKPALEHSHDLHLAVPEISQEAQDRLALIPVQLQPQHGWRKVDDQSAWQYFCFGNLETSDQYQLMRAMCEADAVCAVDWTGAYALRSVTDDHPPLVYLNFRVYSSGINDQAKQIWHDDMERQALDHASSVVALSECDRTSLEALCANKKDINVLLPPLRGDMHELAHTPVQELEPFLPACVSEALNNGIPKCLLTCVVRLSREKNVLRFVRFVEKAPLKELGLVPLLAGATSDQDYAAQIKSELLRAAPKAIIVDNFVSPKTLAGIFSNTTLNFHPCSYDAYGMTTVEAAAYGVPSVMAQGETVGAAALLGKNASIQVDMPANEEAVQQIVQILKDGEKLQTIGLAAQKEALAWDEMAYGKRLLDIISTVCDKS